MSLVPRYQDMKYFNFVNVSIPFKTNKPSFCLILKASHALVCSVYHLGININASDEASLNVTSSFRSFIISRNSLIWLLLDIVSSKGFSKHGIQYFFFRYRCCDDQFPGFGECILPTSGLHCFVLSADCTEGSFSSYIVIFDSFLVFNFLFFNFE